MIGLLVVYVLACVTVNIYFPATAVEKTAEEIVKDVRGEQKPDQGTPGEPRSGLFRPFVVLNLAMPPHAHAQQELQVSNPAIRALKASMKERYGQLVTYLKSGTIGEDGRGMLAIRDTGGLDLKAQASVRRLVEAENKDRAQLYDEVTRALNIDPSQKSRVAEIFAAKWQESAPKGTWVQQSDGTWVRK